MTGRWFTRLCSAYLLLVSVATPAHADQVIGAGGAVALCDGSVDLCCTDLFIAGTLNLDEGTILNVRNLTVLAGGVFNGGSGSFSVSGDFDVHPAGQYNAQQSTLLPGNPACGWEPPAPAPVVGNRGLITLVALLLGLTAWRFRYANALRHRCTSKGTSS
jgi:hypothetical protein